VAASFIGATVVPMSSWWTSEELEYGFNDSGASVAIMDEDRYKRFEKINKKNLTNPKMKVVVMQTSSNTKLPKNIERFESLIQRSYGKIMPKIDIHPDDNAMIMYTSGTTASPKGVVLTHRGICSIMNMYVLLAQMMNINLSNFQDAVLLTVPLFHATGMHVIFLQSFISGRKLVIMYKWDAGAALEIIEKEKITHFTGVPTMSIEMMNHPDLHKRDLSTLRSVGGGGAPTPRSAVKEMSKKFPKATLGQGYGLTEVNAVATLNTSENYISHPDSCGRAIPIVQIEIWKEGENHPDKRKLPTSTPGRVMIRGVTLMKEYWNKPKETAEVVTEDGWFDSGDIGRLDDEGFLYIMDRAKDLIIRGGENISCAEVEAAVYHDPAVAEAAVFGVPHPVLGEEVGVAIHFKNGKSSTLQTIQSECANHIAKFKIPVHLYIYKEKFGES